jgi:excisionase family DNA binding protein
MENERDWPENPVITASEAAGLLGVHRMSIHRAIERGEIVGYRSADIWLVVTASAKAWKKVGHRKLKSYKQPLRSAKMKLEKEPEKADD